VPSRSAGLSRIAACTVEKADEKLQNPAGFRILVHVNPGKAGCRPELKFGQSFPGLPDEKFLTNETIFPHTLFPVGLFFLCPRR